MQNIIKPYIKHEDLAEIAKNMPIVNKEKTAKKKQNKQTSKPITNIQTKDFIYVPSINKQVHTKRILLGESYNQQQAKIPNLRIENQKVSITTPYEFKEFLKHLRDNPSNENTEIYKEITEVRTPWRSNNLNARFEKKIPR